MLTMKMANSEAPHYKIYCTNENSSRLMIVWHDSIHGIALAQIYAVFPIVNSLFFASANAGSVLQKAKRAKFSASTLLSEV